MTGMNHEQLLVKLGNAQLPMGPALQDLMQRVREVGLHKIAAHTHKVPEFTFKTAALHIGTELVRQHLKFSKVASGISALRTLNQNGGISLEKVGFSSSTVARRAADRFARSNAISPAVLEAMEATLAQSAARGGIPESAQLLKELPGVAKGRRAAAVPPPIPPAALRQRPPMPEMIGGMAAGPGAAMGSGGGAPLSRAARGRQTLAHVLTPIDFTKMTRVSRAHA